MSRYLDESEEKRQAFNYFYSLGSKRSLYKVAQKFGKSAPTIKGWSLKFDWDDRVKELDINNGQEVLAGSDAALIVEMDRNRDIIKKGLADFLRRLEKGEVQVDKVRDAVNLMKLDMEYAQFISELRHHYDEVGVDLKVSIDTQETIKSLMNQLHTLPEISDSNNVDDLDNDADRYDVYDDLVNYDAESFNIVDDAVDVETNNASI